MEFPPIKNLIGTNMNTFHWGSKPGQSDDVPLLISLGWLKFPLTLLHSASPSSSHSQWLASYKTLPSPPHPPTTSSLLSSMVQTVFYLDRGSSPKFPILFCLSVPPNALANLYKMLFWSCHLIFLIKYIYQFLIVWIIKPIFTVSHLTQNVVLRVCCLEAISCEGRKWGP